MPRTIRSKLAGVTQTNVDGGPRQGYIRAFCRDGTPIHLVREPDNPHDRNAIGAWITCSQLWGLIKARRQIGYIGAHLAEDLAPLIDAGRPVTATVDAVTGGGAGEHLGVNIFIEKP